MSDYIIVCGINTYGFTICINTMTFRSANCEANRMNRDMYTNISIGNAPTHNVYMPSSTINTGFPPRD